MASPAGQLFAGTELGLPYMEARLDWGVPEPELILAMGGLLACCNPAEVRQAIKDRIQGVAKTAAGIILSNSSVVKPKIRKHCLAQGDEKAPYRVWLHEYYNTGGTSVAGPYVEGRHNHRYPAASEIIRGKYTADEWRPDACESPAEPDTTDLEAWTVYQQLLIPSAPTYTEGEVMTLPSTAIHRLRDIQPGTLTLFVELPARRSFSVAFDGPEGQATQIIPDVDSYLASVLATL